MFSGGIDCASAENRHGCLPNAVAGVVQSIEWTVRSSKELRNSLFSKTLPNHSWGPTQSTRSGNVALRGVKRTGRDADNPRPSSAKIRIEQNCTSTLSSVPHGTLQGEFTCICRTHGHYLLSTLNYLQSWPPRFRLLTNLRNFLTPVTTRDT